ncbi:MAG: hypothetical protein JST96_05420 [Bacteroidetes bacterium]|nr:hypothetical protein [Bacteroidota bacterium]
MGLVKFFGMMGLCVFIACSSSRITHSWTTENLPQKKINKFLVVGINDRSDQALSEKMEDHLVGDLKDKGYDAVSSIREFGPKAFRKMDEDDVINKLQNSGFDAVRTIVLLDKSKEKYYIPGQIVYSPYYIYHRYFWGYYTTMYDRIYSPGYYSVNTRYFWESNLYDIKTKELIYSVQTESFDPSSRDALAHEYGKLIVNNMVRKQIINGTVTVSKSVP